ncbi:MAG TPA: hypothetical protein VFM37_03720 [Pseudonocardiaceae bacterium]|nr:hypothetical protein [Pseudonocardiaceae bacterium]
MPSGGGTDASALVAAAARLRWRAPELTLLLADRASAAASSGGEESVRLRAEVLAVFACNQLGRGASAGGRAVRALRAAQAIGAHVTERLVRVELAGCATDASAPAIALSQLLPVLAGRRRVAPTARAAAMVTAADALAKLGGGPEVPGLLTVADGLYDASRAVEPDAVLLRRGLVHARLAAHHRRIGDQSSAERAARAGLALLDELSDANLETGQVSGALTLELVLALLDSAREAEAVLAAQSLLRRSVRPAGAPAACWVRLTLASRVHLPAGRYALARRLLGDAAFIAERNQLDSLLAECHQLQAHLHERCAELPDAIGCLRAAQLAERRWRSCSGELRTLLAAEFGLPPPAAELRGELAAVVSATPLLDQRGPDERSVADRGIGAPGRLAVGDGRFASRPPSPERSIPRRRASGRHAAGDADSSRLAGVAGPFGSVTPVDAALAGAAATPAVAPPPVASTAALVVPAPPGSVTPVTSSLDQPDSVAVPGTDEPATPVAAPRPVESATPADEPGPVESTAPAVAADPLSVPAAANVDSIEPLDPVTAPVPIQQLPPVDEATDAPPRGLVAVPFEPDTSESRQEVRVVEASTGRQAGRSERGTDGAEEAERPQPELEPRETTPAERCEESEPAAGRRDLPAEFGADGYGHGEAGAAAGRPDGVRIEAEQPDAETRPEATDPPIRSVAEEIAEVTQRSREVVVEAVPGPGAIADAGPEPTPEDPLFADETPTPPHGVRALRNLRPDTGEPFGAGDPVASEKPPQVRPEMSKVPYRRRHSAGQEDEGAAADAARMQGAPGRHRSDVALADLLAEALMAYQNGRRSQLAAVQTAAAPRPTPQQAPTSQPQQLEPEPERPEPKRAERPALQPAQLEPKPARSQQPEPVPKRSEPVPKRSEPVPKRSEPVPERPEPVPEQPELVPEQPEPQPERSELPERSGLVPARPEQEQPEPDPSVTQPTRVQDPPTSPIPVSQVLLDSGDPLGYPYPAMVPPSLVGVPAEKVWREPGTF